jgi:hypothetical protein
MKYDDPGFDRRKFACARCHTSGRRERGDVVDLLSRKQLKIISGRGVRLSDIPPEVIIGNISLLVMFCLVWTLGGLRLAFFITVVLGLPLSGVGYLMWKEKMNEESEDPSPKEQEVKWNNNARPHPTFHAVPLDVSDGMSGETQKLWEREEARGIPSSNTFTNQFITDRYTLSAGGEPIPQAPQTSVQAAVTTLDVDTMLDALEKSGDAVDGKSRVNRHFLMLNIVGEAYKKRAEDPRMKEICKDVGRRHLKEFSAMKNPLKSFLRIDFLPAVPTFQHLAAVLTEDREFDEAIDVCELAIEHGIYNGPQEGFEAKIQAIEEERRKSLQSD